MLYLLSGDKQTGKTRWLTELVNCLEAAGVTCSGVLAPGVFVAHTANGETTYEKLAINNVLLPQHHELRMAVEAKDPTTNVLGMKWLFDTEALDRVNTHLGELASAGAASTGVASTDAASADTVSTDAASSDTASADSTSTDPTSAKKAPSFLVIDELGLMEINGKGLTNEMVLLRQGPALPYTHVLVVVRRALLDDVLALMRPVWHECIKVLTPGTEAAEELMDAFR